MIINSAKSTSKTKNLQPNQIIPKVAKYLYKSIDSAYDLKTSVNTADVFISVLYQLPVYIGVSKTRSYDSDVNEMKLNINLTTYAKKIRMNIIEISPEEKTLGFDTFNPEDLEDVVEARKKIMNKIKKRISKEFADYEFIF